MITSMIEVRIPEAEEVKVTEDTLQAELSDGRTISVPLAWYPRLVHATQAERDNWELIGDGQGIRWLDLDEDLSIEGLIAGRPSGESQSSFKRWLEAKRSNRSVALHDSHKSRLEDVGTGDCKMITFDGLESEAGLGDDIHGSGGYREGEDMSVAIDKLWWKGSTLTEVAEEVGQTVDSVMDTLEAQIWDYHDERNSDGTPEDWQIRAILEGHDAIQSGEASGWTVARLARALKLEDWRVRRCIKQWR